MARIVSVHEYSLKPGVDASKFEQALQNALDDGLLQLPGLQVCHFARGIKGARSGKYVAIWIYDSREAWEKLWGSPEHPYDFDEYPENWQVWEMEVLSPFLDRDPDAITYTTYEEIKESSRK
jgi:hypothetical protein